MKAEKTNDTPETVMQGVQVENLNARTARQLGVTDNTSGVVVTDIDPSSHAAISGLQQGDVIQEVNHHAVRNTSEFESALRNSKDETLLLVNRQGSTRYVAV